MQSLDDIIRKRRSIRKYKSGIPEWNHIESMLECATYSPSPSNTLPVRFYRLTSDHIREELKTEMESGKKYFLKKVETTGSGKKIRNIINAYYRFSEFMFTAPYLFAVGTTGVVSFSDRLSDAGIIEGKIMKNTDFDITTGLALKGFCLKGAELGIGTCILTAPLVYMRDAGAILGEDVRISCFVTAGYPDEVPKDIERKQVSDIYIEM